MPKRVRLLDKKLTEALGTFLTGYDYRLTFRLIFILLQGIGKAITLLFSFTCKRARLLTPILILFMTVSHDSGIKHIQISAITMSYDSAISAVSLLPLYIDKSITHYEKS